jgi:hypothetical protein
MLTPRISDLAIIPGGRKISRAVVCESNEKQRSASQHSRVLFDQQFARCAVATTDRQTIHK